MRRRSAKEWAKAPPCRLTQENEVRRVACRAARFAVCVCVCLASTLGFTQASALAGDTRIAVKGSARIDAHAARTPGKLLVSGIVVDDGGRPLASTRVGVVLSRAAKGDVLPMTWASPAACGESGARPALQRADRALLTTDDSGRFCVSLSLPRDQYVVLLDTPGDRWVDPAKVELRIDLALEPVTLRFDPEPASLSLDDVSTQLSATASIDDDGVTRAAPDLLLTLTNETGTTIETARTDASGRARFDVASERFGAPGRGELRLAFAGSAGAGPSAHSVRVERRTHVDLVAVDARDSRVPAGSPEDGIPIVVRASLRCSRHGCAGTATGSVEARCADAIVGAATLDRGQAQVTATFGLPAADSVELRMTYVPDAPWLLPAGELALTQPVRASSPWKKAPLLVAGVGVLCWLIVLRLPRKSGAPRPTQPAAADVIEHREAYVQVLRKAPSTSGWTGKVTDAHEGSPVAAARVRVERGAFDGVHVLAQAICGPDGTFSLPHLDRVAGDTLLAEGQLHAPLRSPLPAAGDLAIGLVLRKRAILERLVSWALRRGVPFSAGEEPTPGEVRRAALAESPGVARWAEAVERAAYGQGSLDEQAQSEVDRLGPPDAGSTPAQGPLPSRPGPRA